MSFGIFIDSLPVAGALTGNERLVLQQGTVGSGTTVQIGASGFLNGLIPAPSLTQKGGVFLFTALAGQFLTGVDVSGNVTHRVMVSGDLPSIAFSSLTGIPTTVAGYGITDALKTTNNLSDLTNTASGRTALGLGTTATQNTGTSGATIPFLNGVNTWSGTQSFGTVGTATTPTSGDNSTKIATTSFVQTAVAAGGTPGQIQGTSTNDNATSGKVGEFLSSSVLVASGVPLTSLSASGVTSVVLTAGDWDVWGSIKFNGNSATTVQVCTGSLSLTSGSNDSTLGRITQQIYTNVAIYSVGDVFMPVGPSRFAVSGTTSVFLVATSQFSVNTSKAYGELLARRRR